MLSQPVFLTHYSGFLHDGLTQFSSYSCNRGWTQICNRNQHVSTDTNFFILVANMFCFYAFIYATPSFHSFHTLFLSKFLKLWTLLWGELSLLGCMDILLHGLGSLIPLEGKVNVNQCKVVLSDHFCDNLGTSISVLLRVSFRMLPYIGH